MAFPRLSASMLLASVILLLYWTTSSAQSHDPASSDPSPPYRVKRGLPLEFRTREKVQVSLDTAKNMLTFIDGKISKIDTQKLSAVMNGLGKIASLAPVIGTFVTPIIHLVLAFLPQENPLKELRDGFAQVNRRLDSLSTQISNLATDVEWFNYASVYSQDEVRILNAWKKFNELRRNSELAQSEDDKFRLAEIFVNYYENTGTEASVANLYHYLTVTHTSLSENLNELLKKKFKCDITKIGEYNIYFSSLLLKGMVLNQFYWQLIGFNSTDREAEHIQMFKDVYTTQISAVDYCLKNYMEYMEKDVEEISTALSSGDKRTIAVQVKEALDKKYYWHNWVVVVYNTGDEKNHLIYSMKAIPVGTTTVAVGFTQKSDMSDTAEVKAALENCYGMRGRLIAGEHIRQMTQCTNIVEMTECSFDTKKDVSFKDSVKVMHASYNKYFVRVPEALTVTLCMSIAGEYTISIYYSLLTDVCESVSCENGGTCKRIPNSNEYMCECEDGYRRDKCEEEAQPEGIPALKGITVPDITSINAKLELMENKMELMEDKLEKILNNTSPTFYLPEVKSEF